MEKKEIEELVEKKVLEAKLEVVEKRLHYFIWLAGAALALFGAIFPMWISNRASDKVDKALEQMKTEVRIQSQDLRTDLHSTSETLGKTTEAIRGDFRADRDFQARQIGVQATKVDSAIEKMGAQFKELAGAQLRKPVLDCLWQGLNIEGRRLKISEDLILDIKNTGDAPAQNVTAVLYLPSPFCEGIGNITPSDEPSYPCMYERSNPFVAPQQIINLTYGEFGAKAGDYPAILKVFYDREPRKYNFFISIGHNK